MKKTSQMSLLFRQNVNRTDDVLWGQSPAMVTKNLHFLHFYTAKI